MHNQFTFTNYTFRPVNKWLSNSESRSRPQIVQWVITVLFVRAHAALTTRVTSYAYLMRARAVLCRYISLWFEKPLLVLLKRRRWFMNMNISEHLHTIVLDVTPSISSITFYTRDENSLQAFPWIEKHNIHFIAFKQSIPYTLHTVHNILDWCRMKYYVNYVHLFIKQTKAV